MAERRLKKFFRVAVAKKSLAQSHVKKKISVRLNLPSPVTFLIVLGTVYTDAVSFVTASVSMRLRLSFTRRRSSSLSEPGRFEYAFSKVERFQNDTVSLVV